MAIIPFDFINADTANPQVLYAAPSFIIKSYNVSVSGWIDYYSGFAASWNSALHQYGFCDAQIVLPKGGTGIDVPNVYNDIGTHLLMSFSNRNIPALDNFTMSMSTWSGDVLKPIRYYGSLEIA